MFTTYQVACGCAHVANGNLRPGTKQSCATFASFAPRFLLIYLSSLTVEIDLTACQV